MMPVDQVEGNKTSIMVENKTFKNLWNFEQNRLVYSQILPNLPRDDCLFFCIFLSKITCFSAFSSL
jgi:hypothetical protein